VSDYRHWEVPLGQFRVGQIAQDRTPYLTNAIDGDPEIRDLEWAQRRGMVAFAGHPLVVNGRVVGVVVIFAQRALPDAIMPALASVAHHIALGIERYRSAEALLAAEERMRIALQAAFSSRCGLRARAVRSARINWNGPVSKRYLVSSCSCKSA